MRDLAAIQHEAAHLSVGIALGLRLRKAVIKRESEGGWTSEGWCWFENRGSSLSHAIMYAAGVVWERAHGRESPLDYRYMLEELKVYMPSDKNIKENVETRTCLRLAGLLLRSHGKAHRKVTEALMERDLTSADIRAIARGEKVTEEP